MADYIERKAVLHAVNEFFHDPKVDVAIYDVPAANVREDVHGKWVVVEHEYLNCSVCGEAMYTGCSSSKEAMILKDHWKNFCPNCGARMVTNNAPLA